MKSHDQLIRLPSISLIPSSPQFSRTSLSSEESTISAQAQLIDQDLWMQFDSLTNEMIITKSGRCLFPIPKIQFIQTASTNHKTNCIWINLDAKYKVSLQMKPIDSFRWRFRNHRWTHLPSDQDPQTITTITPSPVTVYPMMTGADLMRYGLCLDKIKLCNYQLDHFDRPPNNAKPTIPLRSFHKYQPVISISDIHSPVPSQTISFDCTRFIAVTHYQNRRITALKKEHNPHAKGFPRFQDSIIPRLHRSSNHGAVIRNDDQLEWESESEWRGAMDLVNLANNKQS